ncbi:hypothetical protein [Pseudomonas sp. MPB23]|uniref:hypothetical protein n=1 Tax=Pseudomonas sp. MPB23 TaxID=3388490 RepID=UPI003984E5B2
MPKNTLLFATKSLIQNQRLFASSLGALEQWLLQKTDKESNLVAFRIREELDTINEELDLLTLTTLKLGGSEDGRET